MISFAERNNLGKEVLFFLSAVKDYRTMLSKVSWGLNSDLKHPAVCSFSFGVHSSSSDTNKENVSFDITPMDLEPYHKNPGWEKAAHICCHLKGDPFFYDRVVNALHQLFVVRAFTSGIPSGWLRTRAVRKDKELFRVSPANNMLSRFTRSPAGISFEGAVKGDVPTIAGTCFQDLSASTNHLSGIFTLLPIVNSSPHYKGVRDKFLTMNKAYLWLGFARPGRGDLLNAVPWGDWSLLFFMMTAGYWFCAGARFITDTGKLSDHASSILREVAYRNDDKRRKGTPVVDIKTSVHHLVALKEQDVKNQAFIADQHAFHKEVCIPYKMDAYKYNATTIGNNDVTRNVHPTNAHLDFSFLGGVFGDTHLKFSFPK